MPEGPFSQIRAHIFIVISLAGLPSLPSTNLAFSEKNVKNARHCLTLKTVYIMQLKDRQGDYFDTSAPGYQCKENAIYRSS